MDREQAKREIKAKLEGYLQSKGINTRKAFLCLNPDHADTHPSMSFNRRSDRVKCFSCGASYDIFDLIGIEYNLTDQREIFDKAYSLYGIQIDQPIRTSAKEDFAPMENQKPAENERYTHKDIHTSVYTQTQPANDYSRYFEICKSRLGSSDYPQRRGLSSEILERHGIGIDPEFKTKDAESEEFVKWNALIIPTGKGSYSARNTDPEAPHRNRYRKRGAAQIFSGDTIKTARSPIFVVEGEIDAMSIEEVGGAAVGLGSYDNVGILLKLIEASKPSQPVVISLDEEPDEKKRERVEAKVKELEDGLGKLGVTFYRYNPNGGAKDANEALTASREAFKEAVAAAADLESQAKEAEREAYFASAQTSKHLQEFIDGISESVDTPAISTGFKNLDNALDGGLYEGLIIVGGISSVGKTTLITQIGDQIAQSGKDVIIFSLEMARSELMAKSISRHTIMECEAKGIETRNAKSSRGITDGKRHLNYNRSEMDLVRTSIQAYSAYADHIFITEGMGDVGVTQIRETVEKHIRYTGNRPTIVIDYLQILAPYSERMSDKQNTDKAVLELKRISRDFKIPVIAISSFNRTSYKEAVSMESFKESGSIEYSSDLLLGLQLTGAGKQGFDASEAKKKNPRSIDLVVLKHRNGATGACVTFNYYPIFNYFKEV